MKESIAALSTDKRIQLILIAFCFGAFLEGTGGGGAPVAIAGSFLIGLGFDPFQAATLCLLANTAPVAWGAVGTPIRVLVGRDGSSRSGLERDDRADLAAGLGDSAALAGAQHGRLAGDPRGLAGPGRQRALVRSDAVLLVELPGIGAGRHHRGAGLALGDGGFPEGLAAEERAGNATRPARRWSRRRSSTPAALVEPAVLKGWSPFLLVSVFIFVWGRPEVSTAGDIRRSLKQPMPYLHLAVLRMPPVVPGAGA